MSPKNVMKLQPMNSKARVHCPSSSGSDRQASGRGPSIPGVTPREVRTLARMGNLGWDLIASEAEGRAKDILEKAGICSEQYKSLHAVHTKGSMVEIDFHTSLELRRAHYAVQALAHE